MTPTDEKLHSTAERQDQSNVSDGIRPTTTTSDSTGKENSKEKTEQQAKPPIRNYWRILAFGSRTDHLLMLAALAASTASGVALPLMQIIFGSLVGEFNDYFTKPSSQAEFDRTIDRLSLYIFALFLAKFALCYISMFSFRTVGLRISAGLRLAYMKSLFAQPVAKLDLVSTGAVSNTITSSANTIQISISDRLAYMFNGLALIIAAYAIAFRYSWVMTLVASSGLIFILVVYSFTTPQALKAQAATDKADERHATIAGEIFSSIRAVLSLGAEPSLSTRYIHAVVDAEKAGYKMSIWFGIQLGPAFFAVFATFALSFWSGLKFYADGVVSNVNTVIIAFFSVLIIVSIMGQVVQPLVNIIKAISASTSFFEMIDSKQVVITGLKDPEASAHEDIEFHDVAFAYPSRSNVPVLKGFSAKFEKGKTTAIVGPSGSGKSTIVGLLERWYALDERPLAQETEEKIVESDKLESENSGSITCGKHNISALDMRWWRSQIGLVQQEPFLFNDTIVNNVSFGLLGTRWAECSDEEKLALVKDACKESFADEFIEKLPQGYNTTVGESGIKLSGGQRQRLAIARSIVRKPAILILDEATSAIDVRSEAIVQKALDQVSKERATIVIAHRLATIQKADRIIVLRSGHKVEEGTHEELLKLDDGLYGGLVRAQRIQQSAVEADASPDTLSGAELIRRQSTAAESLVSSQKAAETTSYKPVGFLSVIGSLIKQEKSMWYLMLIILLGAMAAGSSFALQSWFFAKLIETFTFTGQKLTDARDFWALMFFILAVVNFLSYSGIGYSSSMLQSSSMAAARKDYFRHNVRQPIAFFDADDNSSGSIMSRLSTHPKQMGEVSCSCCCFSFPCIRANADSLLGPWSEWFFPSGLYLQYCILHHREFLLWLEAYTGGGIHRDAGTAVVSVYQDPERILLRSRKCQSLRP